jgi:anti-anti-sigma regulatory factor
MTIPDRLVVPADHRLDARREFLGIASQAVERADYEIEIDCSGVEESELMLVGMLVTVARGAHRRGIRVVLIAATPELRRQLIVANVGDRFVIRE